MLTSEQLAEWRRVTEAATRPIGERAVVKGANFAVDSEFIAVSRTAMPALLDAVQELTTERAKLLDEVERLIAMNLRLLDERRAYMGACGQ